MNSNASDISLLLAYANAMSGELLAEALGRHPSFLVAGRAATVSEVLALVQSMPVDVALIGTSLQDGPLSGFAALRKLHECRPEIKSIMLTDNAEPSLVVDAFRAGAKGVFCPSQSEFKMLCKCVERVSAGEIWANSKELGLVMEAFSQLAPLRIANADGLRLLTKREEEVVRLVAEGMQNREIARELNLSEHTVKNYLFKVFDKLGVSSRVELVLYAVSSTRRAETTVGESPNGIIEAGVPASATKSSPTFS
jgi:DNA-binding NarL/FixJ family response regulator